MKLAISIVMLLQLGSQLLLADPIPLQESLPQCIDSDFVITVSNQFELYIDGAKVSAGLPNEDSSTDADRVRIAASSKVIGVMGVAAGGPGTVAGILASGAHSTTDGLWKCTNEFHEGWAGVGFDDSAWPDANVIGDHGISPWGTISGISSDAKWIWTEGYQFGDPLDETVYCRKKRGCINEAIGRGAPCITSCFERTDGDYQSCQGCNVYATCSNGIMSDSRPCPAGLVWDDKLKRCERQSSTCRVTGTGPTCITSCSGQINGDYQSCKGCNVYASCSNGRLYDQRPCVTGLVWDDKVKRCERRSTTCDTGTNVRPGRGSSCITSCHGRSDGDYQSCRGCRVYATCSKGAFYDQRPCPRDLVWDDRLKRCEWKSSTCF